MYKRQALSVVEFINRLYKTKVALLNQIKELHTSADITFGNTDSVSYTHLDVYMRQVIPRVAFIR